MQTMSQPRCRARDPRRPGPRRPYVEALEDRLHPGDAVLGWLLGGLLVGPGPSVLDDEPSTGAPDTHRPAYRVARSTPDLEQTPAGLPVAVVSSGEEQNEAPGHPAAARSQGGGTDPVPAHTGTDEAFASFRRDDFPQEGKRLRPPAPSPERSLVPDAVDHAFFGGAGLMVGAGASTPKPRSSSTPVGSPVAATLLPDPVGLQAPAPAEVQPAAGPADTARLRESYGRLPLSFEANEGQADPRVRFLAHGSGYSLALTPTESVLSLQKPAVSRTDPLSGTPDAAGMVLHMQLLGANTAPQVTGREELPGKVSYYLGNDSRQWHSNIPTYARVEYQNVYPGIDLAYYGKEQQLEYDFIVAPGADPGAIGLRFTGADQVAIDAQGDLVLHGAGGDVRQHKPFLYQEVGGVRHEVAGRFVLRGAGQVGFAAAAYDTSRPLVIDPALVYSSYLGGAGDDGGFGITVDGNGFAYVTGFTNSPPSTWPGPLPTLYGPLGNFYAFVTKVDTTGSFLWWTTFIGGSNTDVGQGIALGTGGVYVAGSTTSPNFPATAGSFEPFFGGGGSDGFAASFNLGTGTLLAATFLGGPGNEAGFGIGVDAASNVYVTGSTDSPPGTWPGLFPIVFGPSAGQDAFVISLDPTLTFENYLTYVCGTGNDVGYGIAVDPAGNAYVTGYTDSANLFTTPGTIDPFYPGHPDGFTFGLNPGGFLVYSTYLRLPGSTGAGLAIAVDGIGSPAITGYFNSGPPSFVQAFVYVLTPGAGGFICVQFFGGPGTDVGQGIAVDSAGNAYLTGWTTSAVGFPVVAPGPGLSPFLSGPEDAFVAKLNIPACAWVYSGYLGGSGSDAGYGIALDSAGGVYVTGTTSSVNFPVTAASFQTINGGGPEDAFVTKLA